MGSRWFLDLRCAHCNKLNKEVFYAPSCGTTGFECEYCSEVNDIIEEFKAVKRDT